jgi:phasin family protein
MNSRVEDSLDNITERARGRYASIVHGARSQTEQAASLIRGGKKPVKTLSRLGVELTSISHRATSKVLKNQARLIENQIDALAGRLHSAARAGNLRDLVRDQIRLIPQNASQFVEDTRQTFTVVAEAGSEVRELVVGTVSELRGSKAPKVTPKKAAKRVASRKSPAKKKAAKKKVAKKATAKARKVSKKTAAAPRRVAAPKPASSAAKATSAPVADSDRRADAA